MSEMRRLISLVEAMSKYATEPPSHIAQIESTPIGKVLFHGTPLSHLLGILERNEISTGCEWRGEGNRVSCTKSYDVAVRFGKQTDVDTYPAVLVLDWAKLAATFKIVPYDDVDCEGNPWPEPEQEKAVYGTIRPLSRFLISVNISPALIQAAMRDDAFIGWVMHEIEYPFMRTKRGVRNGLNRLLHFPKLNVWHP